MLELFFTCSTLYTEYRLQSTEYTEYTEYREYREYTVHSTQGTEYIVQRVQSTAQKCLLTPEIFLRGTYIRNFTVI